MQAEKGHPARTPLHPLLRDMGARMVEFAGWEMPLQFSSVLEEHRAVRTACGLFDVSHMGEIEVEGGDALGLVQRLTCNDAARLRPGQAQYSALTTESGTFLDDILVYRRAADRFLLVVNAGNTDKDFGWIARHAGDGVEVTNSSEHWAQMGLQGPRSEALLQGLTDLDLAAMPSYHFAEGAMRGATVLVSRTGYTGEDGFEIYVPADAAPDLYRAILATGRPRGLLPCGLGARDTLRLEASMLLYGSDIDETTTVLETGLRRIVRPEKGEFVGRAALERQRRDGVARTLVGFEMIEPGIARHGYPVVEDGREVGRVTSGTYGPHLRKSIGMAYVPTRLAEEGTRLSVVIRGRVAAAVVVPRPFYRRPR